MLFLLSAVFALDRSVEAQRTGTERRGWAALAAALALLSLDEVASLHEFLSDYSNLYLAPLGLLGLTLAGYALTNLRRADVPLRNLLFAFGLLATVPFQELVQWSVEWSNSWVYGTRALVEEGTEITAALLFMAVTSGGLLQLRIRPETFASLVLRGVPLLCVALGALPWVGAGLFMACALLVARGAALRREPLLLAGVALYLLASVGSNFINAAWDPPLFGQPVNLRGLFFGSLLLAAPWVLAAGQCWRQRLFWFAPAGCTLVAAFVVQPQAVWSTWPMTLGLLCFYIELSAAVRLPASVAKQRRAATLSTVMTPQDPPSVVNTL
jgi:hypothetical protein